MKHSEKSSTILMFVVFFLSFIVLWNVADLISKVDNQKQRSYTYEESKTVNIVFSELIELRENGKQSEAKEYISAQLKSIWNEIDKIEDCNISLSNIFFQVESQKDNVLCEIILNENIEQPYELQENMDNSVQQLFIGESLIKNCFKENGNLKILLDDTEYSVTGILKNYGINGQDERVVILYNRLDESQKNKLFNQLAYYYYNNYTEGVTFSIGGENKSSVTNTYDKFEEYSNLLEGAEINIVPAREAIGELNYWYELYHTLFGTVAIIFALLNGVIVSKLWFEHHQRELIIRLTYGYSKTKLCMLIFKELGKVAVFSLLFSSIVWGLWSAVKDNHVSLYMIVQQVGIMLIGILLVLTVTILFPLKKIMSLDPVEGLCKCRR